MPSATRRVAARVAEIRAQKGITQESLAAKAHINRVTLARLERAQHPPNLETLERIARALGVALVDLVK
jgi:transcriptional regulator with XRE-family HTH domain